jgi:hypothetical protein
MVSDELSNTLGTFFWCEGVLKKKTSLQTDTNGLSIQIQIEHYRSAPDIHFLKAVADGNVVTERKVVKQ